MPPRSYLLAHPEARLTEAQKALICAWTSDAVAALGAPGAAGPGQ
jgi:hypothetical protein